MTARRRGPRRPNTISASGVTGQKGINLIERIVLDMESRWTPSGQNEVGIDGYIELFDPATRKALGLTLAAQSKVVNALAGDTTPSFDYRCDPADLEYWLSGSMPVILVVSSPTASEAYWVSIKDYFKAWTPASPTTVTFNKAKQRFTKDSLQDLLTVGAPKAGLYLAPARKTEKLHSNLVRVDGFPERIFIADTECRWPSDVWALLRKGGRDADAGWVLRDKRMLSFYNLGEGPWTDVCDSGTVESFPTSDWSESADPDRQRAFVQLLNQTLRAQLSPNVRYWSREECFAIMGEAHKVPYASLRRKSRISAVSQFSKTADDGRVFEWRRHMAFRGQFRAFNGLWFLELTPTYRFTRDGFELHRFHEDMLKGIKQLEGNRAVLSCVLFWADYLKAKSDLFVQEAPPIRFGELETVECPVGIDDKRWLSDDPEFGQEAARQRDALALPDIDDLFTE
jgi:Domain of unknown function (DUF4365)